jgi:multidrug efflux pump subunit AcrA (membrane-fusion protein)
MSQEEMRAEMSKMFGTFRKAPDRQMTQPAAKTPAAVAGGETKFGITQRFDQYQKSAYVPLHQSGRARIWVLNAQKKLEPVFVRTGVTDGRFTEITSPDFKPGDQIVLGVTSNADAAEQATNPFAGQRGRGGGLR